MRYTVIHFGPAPQRAGPRCIEVGEEVEIQLIFVDLTEFSALKIFKFIFYY